MSYSRWSKSRWYSYWDSSSLDHIKSDEYVSEIDKKDLQSLIIWDSKTEEYSFLYGVLVKSQTSSLKKLKEWTDCSDKELGEAQKCMDRFIRDVKEYYFGDKIDVNV